MKIELRSFKMNEPLRLTLGDALAYSDLRSVCEILRDGGLCLVPSDTCYSIAALPFRRDAIARLGRVLPGKEQEPIPLCFGSLALVKKWVRLTPRDIRAIDEFWPGPLTLVCEIAEWHDPEIVSEMLHTVGNIGVRIPDSAVERQISSELERPITTCAVRDEAGRAVQSFDDAISVVRGRIDAIGEPISFAAIRGRRRLSRTVSTVATVQVSQAPADVDTGEGYTLYVFRPGAIEPEKIERRLRSTKNPLKHTP
jgi:L-threonylcarbamoyladenylate synthase